MTCGPTASNSAGSWPLHVSREDRCNSTAFCVQHAANPGATFTNTAATDPRDTDLLGHEGVVEAMLRPAGVVHFDGRRVDTAALLARAFPA